jgi:glycine cleavage system H protein
MSDTPPKSGEYAEGRLWFTRKSSVLTIGVTSLGIEGVGNVQSIEFPSEGDDFEKDDAVITIDGTGGKLEVTAPATGTVHEVNEAAQAEPDMISEDPLEEGWLIKLNIEDPTELLD